MRACMAESGEQFWRCAKCKFWDYKMAAVKKHVERKHVAKYKE